MQQAIGVGQYEFPKGLMFGGKAPSRTLLILQKNLERWIGDAAQAIHLDLHTGLGKADGIVAKTLRGILNQYCVRCLAISTSQLQPAFLPFSTAPPTHRPIQSPESKSHP
jgi:Protein of unknown function (DUF2817)